MVYLTYLYWYCQSLGAVVGLMVCIYAYVRGDMLLLTNISGNFDFLHFGQIIASYTLYPLCIVTGMLGVYISTRTKEKDKKLNKGFDSFNITIITLTIIIGFLGCSIYFIFPTIIFILPYIIKKIITRGEVREVQPSNKNNDPTLIGNKKDINPKLQKTKEEMAVELLKQEAEVDFITEVTGLSNTEVQTLHKLHKDVK